MNKIHQDANGNTSSKRIYGAIGMFLVFAITSITSIYSVYTGNDIGVNAASMVNGMAIVSGSLLGIGVVEHFAKGKDK